MKFLNDGASRSRAVPRINNIPRPTRTQAYSDDDDQEIPNRYEISNGHRNDDDEEEEEEEEEEEIDTQEEEEEEEDKDETGILILYQ